MYPHDVKIVPKDAHANLIFERAPLAADAPAGHVEDSGSVSLRRERVSTESKVKIVRTSRASIVAAATPIIVADLRREITRPSLPGPMLPR